jgi:hypothetical protein
MDPAIFAPDRNLTDDEMHHIRALSQQDVKDGLPGTCWFHIAKTLKLPLASVRRYGESIDGIDIIHEAAVQIPREVFAPYRPLTEGELFRVRELSQQDVKDGLPGTCWFHIAKKLKLPHASVQRYGEDTNGRLLVSESIGSGTPITHYS